MESKQKPRRHGLSLPQRQPATPTTRNPTKIRTGKTTRNPSSSGFREKKRPPPAPIDCRSQYCLSCCDRIGVYHLCCLSPSSYQPNRSDRSRLRGQLRLPPTSRRLSASLTSPTAIPKLAVRISSHPQPIRKANPTNPRTSYISSSRIQPHVGPSRWQCPGR